MLALCLEYEVQVMSNQSIEISDVTEEVDKIVVPLVGETLRVDKEKVVTGGVHIQKVVNEREEIVDEPLMRQDLDVVRIPVDQFVDVAPAVRHEGNTMIVSIVEEVIVIEKRLRVVEEVHITQKRSEYRAPQTVTVRSEEVKVERWEADEAGK